MDKEWLAHILKNAWCGDTALGEWHEHVPSLNQCAVTALVVQDIFGGDLLRCKMTDGDSHYWNRLPDGSEVDFTEEQFSHIDAKPLKETVLVRDRTYVLSYPNTMKRYGILLQRVAEELKRGDL